MPYALTLRLDDRASAVVEGLWRRLSEKAVGTAARAFEYAPHLTLAVTEEDIDEKALVALAAGIAREQAPLPLSLASLGMFLGSAGNVVFLAPVPDAALLACHAAVHAAGSPISGATAHTLPGAWVPHITLAEAVANPADALSALGALRLPTPAVATALEVVRFRPVRVLFSAALSGD